ncbi:MAG: hypothetical protein GY711_19365 [bacterium]|nr:hypothetical protein [bacterium]
MRTLIVTTRTPPARSERRGVRGSGRYRVCRDIHHGLLVALLATAASASAEDDFDVTQLTERISVFVDTEDGTDQLAIGTEDGIVVIDSLWSNATAARFRGAIAKHYGSDRFLYTVNSVDRLDHFGGNATYADTTIVGHANFGRKFSEGYVDSERARLIEMWRWKENHAREENQGSRWINTCKRRADELEQSYSLRLPDVMYSDRLSIRLDGTTLELRSFGKAGYDGMTLIVVPEEHVAIIPGFIFHSQHLAPHPNEAFAELDVPRWIALMEEVLDESDQIEQLIVDTRELWTKERVGTHLHYIKTLWETVRAAKAEGATLEQVQELCSLDGAFAFVKKIQVYLDHGDDWVRPQHLAHVKGFYRQK